MIKVFMVRVDMNEMDEERFKEELASFKSAVRSLMYRAEMTVDEVVVKET